MVMAEAERPSTGILRMAFARLPHEPEDAKITGVTRSLPRRLLALNLMGSRLGGNSVPAQ
jgi:hypothetical protein